MLLSSMKRNGAAHAAEKDIEGQVTEESRNVKGNKQTVSLAAPSGGGVFCRLLIPFEHECCCCFQSLCGMLKARDVSTSRTTFIADLDSVSVDGNAQHCLAGEHLLDSPEHVRLVESVERKKHKKEKNGGHAYSK